MKRALGLVEVFGLVAAVTVADDMVKCADVELIGYELSKGSGMATIKIEGDVGAVQAAISCGEATARSMNMFVGKMVIARPAEGLEVLINNSQTVGSTRVGVKPAKKENAKPQAEKNVSAAKLSDRQSASSEKPASKPAPKPAPKQEPKPASKPTQKQEAKPEPKSEDEATPKTAPKPTTKKAAKQDVKAEPKSVPTAVSQPETAQPPEITSTEKAPDVKENE